MTADEETAAFLGSLRLGDGQSALDVLNSLSPEEQEQYIKEMRELM